jgi:hypothetical protein
MITAPPARKLFATLNAATGIIVTNRQAIEALLEP